MEGHPEADGYRAGASLPGNESALFLVKVLHKRFGRLGEMLADGSTSKRVRVVAQLLLLAAIVFVVLRVRSLWHGSHIELAHVEWGALAGALALAAAGTAGSGLTWLAILDALGVRTHRHWAGLYFQAQLGKYIPGSVWQYAGRVAMARGHGIPVRPVGASLPIEFAATAAAGGSMAAFLLGWWGLACVAAVAVFLISVERVVRARWGAAVFATVRATVLYLPVWLLLGGSLWLCARGLVIVPAHDLAMYMGVFAVAWLAGLVAIYAPGGIGVREAVLVALLSNRIGTADAFVVAVASRLILVLVDLTLAGIAVATMRRRRTQLDTADRPA